MMDRRKIIQLIILAGILAFYLMMIVYISRLNVEDFVIFYGSAENYYDGKNIYTPIPIEKYAEIPLEIEPLLKIKSYYPNLNPPFLTLIFLPFPLLKLPHAFLVWSVFSLLLGLISAQLIEKYMRIYKTDNRSSFLTAIMLFAFFPTMASVAEGQLTLLILFLLTLSFWSSRSDKEPLAGICLGLALSIKLFAGLFLLYYLVQRRYKLIAWCLGTFIAASLLALLFFGVQAYQEYLKTLGDIGWYSLSWNASLMGYFTRLFGGLAYTGVMDHPEFTRIIVYSLDVILMAILVWVTWPRYTINQPARLDMGFALTLVTMLLVSPFGWLYYFPFLIIPAILLLRISSLSRFPRLLVLFIWIALSIWPFLPRSSVSEIYILIQLGFYTYMLVIFFALMVWSISHLRRDIVVSP